MHELGDLAEFAAVMGILAAFVPAIVGGIVYAVRLARRSASTPTAEVDELRARLARLEQAVDVVAVEVERVGEGQRYVERILVPAAGATAGAPPAAR